MEAYESTLRESLYLEHQTSWCRECNDFIIRKTNGEYVCPTCTHICPQTPVEYLTDGSMYEGWKEKGRITPDVIRRSMENGIQPDRNGVIIITLCRLYTTNSCYI